MLKGLYHTQEEIEDSFTQQELNRFKELNLDRWTVEWKETEKSKVIKWLVLVLFYGLNFIMVIGNLIYNPEGLVWTLNLFVILYLIENEFKTTYETVTSTYEVWPKYTG